MEESTGFRPHLWGALSILSYHGNEGFLDECFRPHLWGALSIYTMEK